MKTIILFASVTIAAGLTLTNIYTSIIDARSWGSHIPESIGIAREYYKTVNPGNFFRIFSPINQVLGLLALIVCWKSSPQIRLCVGISFCMYLLAEGLTFQYFYPRNFILFKTAQLTDVDLLKKTWSEWNTMNWVRTGMLVVGLIFSFLAIHKLFALRLK